MSKKNSILIDNWTFQQVAALLNSSTYSDELEYLDHVIKRKSIESLNILLSSYIFSDELCFYNNGFSHSWLNSEIGNQLKIDLLPINLSDDDKVLMEKLNKQKINELDTYNYSQVVSYGAIEYLYISNLFGLSYMGTYDRISFLKHNGIFDFGNNLITNYIDNEVKQFHREISEKLDFNNCFIEIPCITNFIVRNSESKESLIPVAKELKRTKSVSATRDWINKVDSYIDSGNSLELKYELSHIDEVFNSLQKEVGRESKSVLNIGISPSISFPISLDIFKRRKGHIVFLNRLVEHNLKNQLSKQYLKKFFCGK